MTRVKRGTIHVKRRTNLLAKVKGFKWGRKNLIKLAKPAAIHAGVNAYRDRRKKKADFRALWQIRIGAFAKQHDLSYSRLIDLLKKANISLDRKSLADLAANHPEVLVKVIEQARS
jgi:large subunit ribosomal protein L20